MRRIFLVFLVWKPFRENGRNQTRDFGYGRFVCSGGRLWFVCDFGGWGGFLSLLDGGRGGGTMGFLWRLGDVLVDDVMWDECRREGGRNWGVGVYGFFWSWEKGRDVYCGLLQGKVR